MNNINDLNETQQINKIKQDTTGEILRFIQNPSEKIQLEAVKENGYVIRNIKNPTEKVQLEAVKNNPPAIQFIENPSEAVKLVAFDYELKNSNPTYEQNKDNLKLSYGEFEDNTIEVNYNGNIQSFDSIETLKNVDFNKMINELTQNFTQNLGLDQNLINNPIVNNLKNNLII